MRPTFHLIPVALWDELSPHAPLVRESLELEGFIHCTDGAAALIATAERHYRSDDRAFLTLTIDLDSLTSPWRYDDEAEIYPHVYGPINRAAIVEVATVVRTPDGRFIAIEATTER